MTHYSNIVMQEPFLVRVHRRTMWDLVVRGLFQPSKHRIFVHPPTNQRSIVVVVVVVVVVGIVDQITIPVTAKGTSFGCSETRRKSNFKSYENDIGIVVIVIVVVVVVVIVMVLVLISSTVSVSVFHNTLGYILRNVGEAVEGERERVDKVEDGEGGGGEKR
ncbi:hypothetical protein M0802_009773 [Mischocyttarus mexicanus]|nr:hypothetical protein M0802_009773 [Mischocyttarus mexicanus]